MGMFNNFLGQNNGYTGAQRTSLQRSAGIKKKRKEEEKKFEREKMKFAAGEAEKGRGHKELLSVMEGLQKEPKVWTPPKGEGMKPQPESQMELQKLKGEQAAALSKQKAEQSTGKPVWKSFETYEGDPGFMEMGTGETLYPKKRTTPTSTKTLGERIREGLVPQKDYTFSEFTGLEQEEQKKYMAHMKSKDREKYLDFARQYKQLYAPE